MSNSGLYGASRLCTGIFGTADLRLGKGVEAVLQAHIAASPNFRGVRNGAVQPRVPGGVVVGPFASSIQLRVFVG